MNLQEIINLATPYAIRLVGAVLALIIGLWIIKILTRQIGKRMDKGKVDPTLKPFTLNIFKLVLKILLIIAVLSTLGVEMVSFVAILGGVGLAVGLALSGTLQNFAGGVMLIIFKPFKVGDYIDAQGYSGTVKEIQIFNTILKTPDNKIHIVPNGGLSTSAMTNYSTMDTRRVDFTFGIGYTDDINKAKEVINGLIGQDDRILKEPAHFIAVTELADSSVNLVTRVWCEKANYWGIYHDMLEKVKNAFDAEGISIPYPQTDVHVHQQQ